MFWVRFAKCVGLLLLLGTAAQRAQATVVFSDTVLAKGPEFATVIDLALPAAGQYRITATDLNWFKVPLQALSFGVFTATGSLVTHAGGGTLDFFNAGHQKVFLQVFVRAAPGKSAGLIALQAEDVAVVALPASLWLLLSAFGATGFWRWWERRVAAFTKPVETVPVV